MGSKLHHLTIDANRCRGVHLCHQCEAMHPGLVEWCETYGRVDINEWASRDHSQDISRLIVACPERAITVQPAKEVCGA